MSRDRLARVSRALSHALRHAPHEWGLELDASGWARVESVLHALAGHGLEPGDLHRLCVTELDGKRRFETSADGLRVRAIQGHSVPVEPGHPVTAPPRWLWHGTSRAAVAIPSSCARSGAALAVAQGHAWSLLRGVPTAPSSCACSPGAGAACEGGADTCVPPRGVVFDPLRGVPGITCRLLRRRGTRPGAAEALRRCLLARG
jgi:hypothetical protein